MIKKIINIKFSKRVVLKLVHRIKNYLAGIIILFSLLVLPNYKLFDLELNIYDILVKTKYLLNNTNETILDHDIALVLIDDEAIRLDSSGRLNDLSALSRTYLTDLLNHIIACRPKVIGIDFLLDYPAFTLVKDDELATALASSKDFEIPVVLATRLVHTGNLTRPILPLSQYLLLDNVFPAHSTMLASPVNNVIRTMALKAKLFETDKLAELDKQRLARQIIYYDVCREDKKEIFCFPAFATALLEKGYPDEGKKFTNKFPPLKTLWIDFTIPPDLIYSIYSSGLVLKGTIGKELKNKIVLVGAAYTESSDRYPTPLSVNSLPIGEFWIVNSLLPEHLAGIEIQGFALSNLINLMKGKNGITRVANSWLILLMGVLAFFVIWLSKKIKNEILGFIITILPIIVYLFICVSLFLNQSVYIPLLRPTCSFFLVISISYHIRQIILKEKN